MKILLAVLRKELTITFSSAIFYSTAFIFLAICGLSFWAHVGEYSMTTLQASKNPFMTGPLNLSDLVVKPFLIDTAVILLLMVPLLTMRTFAEEKKNGTIELLFTYPLPDTTLLYGKFLAVLLVLLVLLAGTLPSFLLLSRFGRFDWSILLTGYTGLVLMGAGFISLGIFISALTENQIIAAVVSFGTLFLLLLLGWAKGISGPFLGAILAHLSLSDQINPFIKGLFDTRTIVYYLLFTFFWLFLTLRYLNSRYWRG